MVFTIVRQHGLCQYYNCWTFVKDYNAIEIESWSLYILKTLHKLKKKLLKENDTRVKFSRESSLYIY